MIIPEKTATPTNLVTAGELLRLGSKGRYELVEGVLIEMSPPGYEHGKTVSRVDRLIGDFVDQRHLGQVVVGDPGFRLSRNPDTVRAPDVAFVSKARLPAVLPTGYADFAPDLVVEVVSPGDDPDEIQAKVNDWLKAEVRLVLVVFPRTRQVTAYRSLREVTSLTETETLTMPDLLPGFSAPVSHLFE